MKIALDVTSLAGRMRFGIFRCVSGLIKGLTDLKPEEEIVLSIMTPPWNRIALPENDFRVVRGYLPMRLWQWLWKKGVPLSLDAGRAFRRVDIFHSLCLPWVRVKMPCISTVHDLAGLRDETFCPPGGFDKEYLKDALKRNTWLIAVSESTRQDVESFVPAMKGRVSVVSEGVDTDFFSRAEDKRPAFVERAGLEKDNFFLVVGMVQPRKNVARIIQAYLLADVEQKLFLAGKPGWNYEDVARMVADHGRRVLWFKNIDDNDLRWLYQHAAALVYCSLYEGFGLPILEAFAAGCPVITSITSSMPEVAGDAAVLVNPNSEEDIAGAITSLAGDAHKRKELSQKGLLRAKKFSWRNVAEETINVYRNVAGILGI